MKLFMPSNLTLQQSGTIGVISDINKLSAKNYDLLQTIIFPIQTVMRAMKEPLIFQYSTLNNLFVTTIL